MMGTQKNAGARGVVSRGGWHALLLVLLSLAGLAGLGARLASAQPGRKPKSPGPRPPAPISTVLTNGTGDGTADATVDAYGEIVSLNFDPSGTDSKGNPLVREETTFDSKVWFSGVNNTTGGGGVFLESFNGSMPPIDFLSKSGTRAVSRFAVGGLQFDLIQDMLPASPDGSTFRQTYQITNVTTSAVSFDLIRYYDGDLIFDDANPDPTVDNGGVTKSVNVPPGLSPFQTVFEFEANRTALDPSSFVGIDLHGMANLGFRLADFDGDPEAAILGTGRGFLTDMLTRGTTNAIDADTTPKDGFTDTPYDVTLSLGVTVGGVTDDGNPATPDPTAPKLQPGEIYTFITDTVLGRGTPAVALVGPTGLQAKATSPTTVKLQWTDNSSDEISFRIERKPGPTSASFEEIGSVGADVTTFTDKTVQPKTTYVYRVRAEFPGRTAPIFSPYSNEAPVTTPPNPPAAPTLNGTVVSASEIDLTWTAVADVDTYELERQGPTDGSFVLLATLPGSTTTFNDVGLQPATTYSYRVRAVNVSGTATSNVVTLTTLPLPPAAPTNLHVTAFDQTTVTLAWNDNSNNETGFELERTQGMTVTIINIPADTTTFTDTGLTANTTYSYRIRAVNTGGASAFDGPVSVTTLPNPPAAPTNLHVTAFDQTTVTLAWNDNSSNETGFELERTQGMTVTIINIPADTTTFTDTGLSPATTYSYRIRAVNTGGGSTFDGPVSVTTLPNPPTAPTNLRVTAFDQTTVTLAWNDNSSNETGFELERTQGMTVTTLNIPANTTTFTDTGLTANTTYGYRIRAVNTGGASAFDGPISVTTLPNPPAAPSGFRVVSVTDSSVTFAWTDNSDNETGFELRRTLGPPGAAPREVATDVIPVPANDTSFTDTGLAPATTYTYTLRAVNTGGASADAGPLTVTTLPAPNAPPFFVEPTPSDGTVITKHVGDTITFTVAARDSEGDVVTLSVSGLPAGATHTPSLPAGSEGSVSSTFSWTPTAKAKVNLTYTATDGKEGHSVQRGIKLVVEAAPIGACFSGVIKGIPDRIRIDGSAGYPRGSKKLQGKLTVKNSTRKITIHSIKFTSFSAEGRQVTVAGTAKVNGKAGHTFRLVALDGGPPSKDRLLELTIDGASWPSGPLKAGDVHMHFK